jgi:hypothetical protein
VNVFTVLNGKAGYTDIEHGHLHMPVAVYQEDDQNRKYSLRVREEEQGNRLGAQSEPQSPLISEREGNLLGVHLVFSLGPIHRQHVVTVSERRRAPALAVLYSSQSEILTLKIRTLLSSKRRSCFQSTMGRNIDTQIGRRSHKPTSGKWPKLNV